MGAYINPPGEETKEKWLEDNAEKIDVGEAKRIANNLSNGANTQLPVCLVDNGPFTAAGIVWSEREFKAFSREDDYRPKEWFKANIDDLLEVSGELEKYLNGVDWYDQSS